MEFVFAEFDSIQYAMYIYRQGNIPYMIYIISVLEDTVLVVVPVVHHRESHISAI